MTERATERDGMTDEQRAFREEVEAWAAGDERGYPEPPELWHPGLDALLSERSREILDSLRELRTSHGWIVPHGAVAARFYQLEAESVYQERSRRLRAASTDAPSEERVEAREKLAVILDKIGLDPTICAPDDLPVEVAEGDVPAALASDLLDLWNTFDADRAPTEQQEPRTGPYCRECGRSGVLPYCKDCCAPTDEAPEGREEVDRHEPSTWTNERLAATLEDFIDQWAPATTTYKAHMEAARRLRQPEPDAPPPEKPDTATPTEPE